MFASEIMNNQGLKSSVPSDGKQTLGHCVCTRWAELCAHLLTAATLSLQQTTKGVCHPDTRLCVEECHSACFLTIVPKPAHNGSSLSRFLKQSMGLDVCLTRGIPRYICQIAKLSNMPFQASDCIAGKTVIGLRDPLPQTMNFQASNEYCYHRDPPAFRSIPPQLISFEAIVHTCSQRDPPAFKFVTGSKCGGLFELQTSPTRQTVSQTHGKKGNVRKKVKEAMFSFRGTVHKIHQACG